MGGKWRSFREPHLSLPVQQGKLRAIWPQLSTSVARGALVVEGVVRPSPVTREYRIRLSYVPGRRPRVEVLSPRLARRAEAPDVPIPHTYDYTIVGEERPCVYYPFSREWTPAMPLATTIMPWLLAWLVDYELWLATGEWMGGGMPHGSREKAENAGS